ncbi:hypothetical protein F4808DRAFT_424925 [Astrocystis sublimbata]|nr:hypothetical protein F4808DRAFT_424925 [Astrocystis sublimbata]
MGPELVIVETFVEYGIAATFILARIFTRHRQVGWRGFRADDYLVVVVLGLWTVLAVVGYKFTVVAQGRHTSLLTPEQRQDLPVSERPIWAFGSQLFLAGFVGYVFNIWLIKLNQLFYYQRVLNGLRVQKLIIPMMGLLGTAFVAAVLTIALYCVPLEKLWQVYPDPGKNCVPQTTVVFTVVLSLNLLTDLCILLLPIPTVISIQLPILKKLGLLVLFSGGLLSIAFAILRYAFIFNVQTEAVSALWTGRELFVATFAGQAPMIYPLLTRRFWARNRKSTKGSALQDLSGSNYNRVSASGYETGGAIPLVSRDTFEHRTKYPASPLEGLGH